MGRVGYSETPRGLSQKERPQNPIFYSNVFFFPVTKMAWKLCLIASLAFINGISAEAEAEADPQYFQLGNRLGEYLSPK